MLIRDGIVSVFAPINFVVLLFLQNKGHTNIKGFTVTMTQFETIGCSAKECDRTKTHTHTHTPPLNGPLSGTTRVSRYQKSKTNLDFTGERDSEWQWHQLGHMQVCTSLQHPTAQNKDTYLKLVITYIFILITGSLRTDDYVRYAGKMVGQRGLCGIQRRVKGIGFSNVSSRRVFR